MMVFVGEMEEKMIILSVNVMGEKREVNKR